MAFIDPGAVSSLSTGTSTWANNVRASLNATGVAVSTTKGDLAVATGSQAVARLAAGANDATLVPDSSTATGLAWQIQPAAHVTKSDATVLVRGVWTPIPFDTETSDPHAMHNPSANPERLTVPAGGAGWYTFGCFAGASGAGGATDLRMRILLNGTTTVAQMRTPEVDPGDVIYLTLTGSRPLAVGDYLVAEYYTPNIIWDVVTTMEPAPVFWAVWQRRQ